MDMFREDRRYRSIYADPPWTFKTYSEKGTGRSAVAHYQCLTLDDLRAMDIGALAAPDCALFLWTTDPMIPQALDLIDAWGFTYKTVAFTWAKTRTMADPDRLMAARDFPIGCGYWTRANPEQCLLATRGRPIRRARDVRQLVIAPRREHSRKPDEVYERIERLVGVGTRKHPRPCSQTRA